MVYDKNGDGVVIPGEYTITITEGGIIKGFENSRHCLWHRKKIVQPFLKK